jgi:integrase
MRSKKKAATKPQAQPKAKKHRATVGYLPGGRVIFAFALTPADRDLIHKAAGPGKASAFVLQAALRRREEGEAMRAPFQRPGSTRWHWEFRKVEKRYCGSADTKAQAQTAMTAKRAEVFRDEPYETIHGHKPFKPSPMSFGEYADYYFKTFCAHKKFAQRDREILAYLKNRWKLPLSALTTKMIADFKAERGQERQPATVLQEIQVIKRMLKKAVGLHKLHENPALTIERPEVHNERVKFLNSDEMKALMSACPDWVQPIVIFARFTGARQGEIFKLTWRDLDFKRSLITFRDTKNGSTGTVRMNATTRTLLESLPRPINPSLPVFTVNREKLRYHFDLAVEKAGLKRPCACLQANGGKPTRTCSSCSGTRPWP